MVELLGAVVILGILMMVAIPSISSLIQNSKNKYYISQKKNLESAAKSYYENNKIILRNEGDYVDVSLEELVKKKYISKMVDGTKAECVMSKPAGNETSQEYTFVRIKKEGNRVTYTSHLYCPAYQDEKLGVENEANIDVDITTDGIKMIVINLKHNDNKVIKSYTYQLYRGDNNIVKKTLTNKDSDVSISCDVERFITEHTNIIKVYVYAIDEDGKAITVLQDVEIIDEGIPRCEDQNIKIVKDNGTSFDVEYSFSCYSKNGCESTNNKGKFHTTEEGTQTKPNLEYKVPIYDKLTGNSSECIFSYKAIHEFTLRYDDNGGSGCANMSPITKEKGLTWGNACTPSHSDGTQEFLGWEVDGQVLKPNELANTPVTKNVVAVAKWRPFSVITYMKNTSSTDTTKITENKKYEIDYSLLNNTWTNSDKVFLGWATVANATASSGTWYDPGYKYNTDKSLTLYAQWYDVNSLENKYAAFIQSGDYSYADYNRTAEQNMDMYGYSVSQSTVWPSSRFPNGYKDGKILIGYMHYPYRVMHVGSTGQDEQTLWGKKVIMTANSVNTHLYRLALYKRTLPSITNIDDRIDRLIKIGDVAITYSDLRTIYRDKSVSVKTGNTPCTVTNEVDSGYEYVTNAGFNITGTNSKYVFVTANCLEVNSGVKRNKMILFNSNVPSSSNTVNVTLRTYIVESKIKKARTTKYTPTGVLGLDRYKTLESLRNTINNYLTVGHFKIHTITGKKLSTGTNWDVATATGSISITSGKFLGVVEHGVTDGKTTGDNGNYASISRVVFTGTDKTSGSLDMVFYGGNSTNESNTGTIMKDVYGYGRILYVSSYTIPGT
jgi:Tfp pilus assembly protein PilE